MTAAPRVLAINVVAALATAATTGPAKGVMTAAMTLNLLLAALVGVMAPMIRNRLGQDPAVGSSVIITAVTDSGGFFIFLGLATIFLM